MSEITMHHFGINVIGALSLTPVDFDSFCAWSREMSNKGMIDSVGFRKLLKEAAAMGHKVVPFGVCCSHWDFQKGCLGHERYSTLSQLDN